MLAFYLQKFDDESDKILFAEIYEKYQQRMYKIAYKYLNNVQLSEDCVNDSFLALIESFKTFAKLDEEKRGSYIYTITERQAFRIYNKEKKQNNAVELIIQTDEWNKSSQIEKIDIVNALQSMPFEYSYPLYLKYAQEQTYSEIADILNISEVNARQRVKRGKDMLIKILTEGDKCNA